MMYFKFHMDSDEPTQSSAFGHLAAWLLAKILPMANPDFERKFSRVAVWAIEFDEDNQWTSREIGMDKDGRVLTKAPFRHNLGIWCDSKATFDVYEKFAATAITMDEFECLWAKPIEP